MTSYKLHTATCTATNDNSCRKEGYYSGGSKGTSQLVFGQLPTTGSFVFGDAYDCDVNGDKTFVAHWDALPGPDDPIIPVNPDDPDVPTDPEVPEGTAGDTPDTRDFVAKNAGVSLVSLFVIVALYWFTRRGRRAN